MTKLEVVATVSDDQKHQSDANSVCLHGEKVFTCADDGKVKVWDHHDLKLLHEFQAHDYGVNDLLVLGNTLFTCSVDATVKSWDVNTFQLKKTLSPHEESVRKLATNGTSVFAGDDKGEVRVYTEEGDLLAFYSVVEEVWGLHAQENLLYTVRDRGVTITQTKGETNKFTVTKSLDGRAPLCVVGGNLVVPEASGLSIIVYDNTSSAYTLRGQLQGHAMIITSLAGMSEDRLVSAGWDNTARVWDLHTLAPLTTTPCTLPGCPNTLAASPDGCVFAAGIGGYLCKMKLV
ncbi:hypothetical protein OTU49_007218 [Cherax quadricarinatus]|uniref:Uncharacterized protein n=2 Tax=Cherax quadricarinatus TaxID=27406 RepID=A0AAW0WZ06_CHEQU|nr:myosin heavy chain kinase B-like isoform X2 [Cherax quadricarinatus]